jgi:hypothetical protein
MGSFLSSGIYAPFCNLFGIEDMDKNQVVNP